MEDEANNDDDGDEEKRPQSKWCSHVASICYFDSIYVANAIFGLWYICKQARTAHTVAIRREWYMLTIQNKKKIVNTKLHWFMILIIRRRTIVFFLFFVSFARLFHPICRRSDWSRIWKRLESVSFVKFRFSAMSAQLIPLTCEAIIWTHSNDTAYVFERIGGKRKIWMLRTSGELTSVPWTLSFMWSSRVVFPSFRFFQQYPSRR